MSTHARIGISCGKTVKTIFVHYDGNSLGLYLEQYYNTPEAVEELISYGDAITIGECIGDKIDYNDCLKVITLSGKQCMFFHRDKGEPLVITEMTEDELADSEEFNYLYKRGSWRISCNETNNEFVKLKDIWR